MTRSQVAVLNADRFERSVRNAGRLPLVLESGWQCSVCGNFVSEITHVHAARCGFSSVAEMKESPRVRRIGGWKGNKR